ncbi:peptidoglycan DD-metalloendopeptidase family protein [Streptomyces albus]
MASEPEGPAPQSSGNAPQRDSVVPTTPYGGAPYGGSVPGGSASGGSVPGGSVPGGTAPGGAAPQPGEPWDEWNPGDEPTRPLRGRHRVARQRTGGVARGGAVLGVGMIAAVGASGMATAHDKDPGSISVPDLGDVTDAVDELSDRLPADTEDLPAVGAPATGGTATTDGTAPADGTVAAAAHRTAPDTPATADTGDAGNALLARLLAQAGAAPRDGAAETPAEPAHETAAEAPQEAPAATVDSADTDGSAPDGRADGPANRPTDGPADGSADGPADETAPVSEQPSGAPENKQDPAPAPATDARPATSPAADADATARTEPAPATTGATTTGATTGTASGAAAKGTYTKPLASYRLSAGFGQAGNMWQSEHTGQDFTAPNGTPVKAVHGGTVKAAGWAGSYGYRVVLRLDDGTEVWFCHLSSMTKSAGDKVATGEVIGRVGSTGTSSGPHLHVEVRPDGGAPVDPLSWLHERGVEV